MTVPYEESTDHSISTLIEVGVSADSSCEITGTSHVRIVSSSNSTLWVERLPIEFPIPPPKEHVYVIDTGSIGESISLDKASQNTPPHLIESYE